MMRLLNSKLLLALVMCVPGCSSANSTLVGSWEGKGTIEEQPFQFTSMTFAPDGTYTAIARYSNAERFMTGHWKTINKTLSLDQGTRTYAYKFKDESKILFTDTHRDETLQLNRVP
ncbi:MAG: hypothetical protein VX527_03605 [Planctomycetota bacterium]|nr:hypothetical protein [Planctomycetota bacterium]